MRRETTGRTNAGLPAVRLRTNTAQVTESLEETVPSDILGKLPNLQYFASVSGGRLIKGRFPILKHD